MEALGDGSARLRFNVNWMGAQLPAENKQGMMAGQAANFELLKSVCENNPAWDRPVAWVLCERAGTMG